MPENNLERFIERILQIQENQKQQKLSQKELKDIAFEMGLNELDWRKIEETTNNHLIRAKGYMSYQNWEDAIKELEQAYPLNPQNADLLYNMAYSYKMQWQNTGNEVDKKQAESYARQCLNFTPTHKEAIQLISSFKRKEKFSPKNSKKKYLIIGIVLFIIFLLLYLTLYQTSDISMPKEHSIPPKEAVNESSAVVSEDATSIPPSDIPVQWIKNKNSKGLKFNLESSKFSDYKESYSYKMTANINIKNIEVDLLKIKTELIDENNNVVQAKIKDAWSEYQSTLRSKDIIPLDVLIYVKEKMPRFKKVKIIPYLIEKRFSDEKYEPSPKISFKWAILKPKNYNLEVRERFSSFSGSGTIYHKLVLEIKNTGRLDIKKLRINLRWLNKDGKLVSNKMVYATISSQPKIQRGQTRIHGGTWRTPFKKLDEVGKLEVEVTEIE